MKTVLIVEDDRWLADIWKQRIEATGRSATTVRSGIDAINACDDAIPGAIVLDIVLPGPNGISLLHELQSHADLSSIPVIVVTSLPTVSGEQLAPYGVTNVFQKDTVTPAVLVAAIEKVAS